MIIWSTYDKSVKSDRFLDENYLVIGSSLITDRLVGSTDFLKNT